MVRSHRAGVRRGIRRVEPVPAHPFVAGVDGRCVVCRLPEDRTDVHGLPVPVPGQIAR